MHPIPYNVLFKQLLAAAIVIVHGQQKIASGVGIVRSQGQSLFIGGNSLPDAALGGVDCAKIAQRLGMVWFYADGPFQILFGLGQPPAFLQGGSKVAKGFWEIGFQAERLLKTGDGFLDLSQTHEGVAEIVAGHGVVRDDFCRLFKSVHRLWKPAPRGKGVAQVAQGAGIVRPYGYGGLQPVDGLIPPTLIQQGAAKVVHGGGVVRVHFQNLAIEGNRLIQFSSLIGGSATPHGLLQGAALGLIADNLQIIFYLAVVRLFLLGGLQHLDRLAYVPLLVQ